ncbi:hypothetical protein HOLleu_35772 [Holothuria leucospilota]|uniref:Reverse transcriptase domain-containing protein n=1 Tax=Holothuria leucospilota TaxID=206669 RepID=A0A9Q1BFA7_HOLLE|nr:hypothetical protein HOLleu_35772 [Holothuria leucospilota]
MGDFNAKSTFLGSTADNHAGRALEDLLDTEPITCLNTGEPTRYPYNAVGHPEQLDYILVSNNLHHLTYNYSIGEDLQSDHFPIHFNLASSITKIPPSSTYNYKKADWKIYQDYITTNLTEVHPTTPEAIDTAAHRITEVISSAIKASTPQMPTQQRFKLPAHIVQVIKQRRQLRRIHQRTQNEDIKTTINQLKRRINQLIADHYKSQFDNKCKQLSNEKDAGAFWKTVKRITKSTPSAPTIPRLSYNGNTSSTNEEKAETFRSYFSTVHRIPDNPAFNPTILQQAEDNINTNRHLYTPQPQLIHHPPPNAQPITIEEILTAIKRSRNTAPGNDGIRYIHIRAAPIILHQTLCNIYNASFIIGHIPSIWKTATTILLPKPNKSTTQPQNYRPISLLPILGKCMEKVVAKRLSTYLEDHNILPNYQAGFRRKRSTTDQLFHFVQHTSSAKHRGHTTIAAFFDAEKAFDRMWHAGLLLKCKHHNLPPTLTRWIANFLTDRQTRYKVGNILSNPLHITTGTPQGSTISPILYILYVADIPKPLTSHPTHIAQYADDIASWSTSPDTTPPKEDFNTTSPAWNNGATTGDQFSTPQSHKYFIFSTSTTASTAHQPYYSTTQSSQSPDESGI